MKRFITKYLAITAATLGLLFLAYPTPDKDFLFRNLPELQGKTTKLIGSSTVLFLDPSFYYRFELNETEFLQLMQQLELEAVEDTHYTYYKDTVFDLHKPFFWHNWWWKPVLNNQTWLFEGYRNGNVLTFLYAPEKQKVLLYIQNT